MELELPEAPNPSQTLADGRMFAPAAARNVHPICNVLQGIAPSWGSALEIASGTGEHIFHFAENLPSFQWQPSDIDDDRMSSIRAWKMHSDATNIADPIYFDATKPLIENQFKEAFSLIVCVNLFHLISDDAAEIAIANFAQLLAAYGALLIYGPFKRGEVFASKADNGFDKLLRDQAPEIGLKDVEVIRRTLVQATNRQAEIFSMPANNLAVIVRAR